MWNHVVFLFFFEIKAIAIAKLFFSIVEMFYIVQLNQLYIGYG